MPAWLVFLLLLWKDAQPKKRRRVTGRAARLLKHGYPGFAKSGMTLDEWLTEQEDA